jgi:hypothetical protein
MLAACQYWREEAQKNSLREQHGSKGSVTTAQHIAS